MPSKRFLSRVALAMALAMGLAACGGDSDNNVTIGPVSTASDAFVTQMLTLIATSPDNTEPTSIDSIAVTTPDNIEPVPII